MPNPQEKPAYLLLCFTEGGSAGARQTGTRWTLQECPAWSPTRHVFVVLRGRTEAPPWGCLLEVKVLDAIAVPFYFDKKEEGE